MHPSIEHFNAAIQFAMTQGLEAREFLHAWVHGDTSEWPEFVPPSVEIDLDLEEFLDSVRAEMTRARTKFPGDRIMTLALAEEFGETVKAVLDEPRAAVHKEAVQAATMCARLVLDGDSSVEQWRKERGLDPLVEKKNA